MADDFDEFSFLPAQASDIDVSGPLPRGERLDLALPDRRTLSALRYSPAGDDRPPVVTFLHGAGLNAHTWDTTILSLGLPALAIDLAGHGDSSWRADAAYVPRVLAPDVVAALRAWTVAGLGMGLAYAPLSLMMLQKALPGQEGQASASLNLADVLGTAIGIGVGGAAVAAAAGPDLRVGIAAAFAAAAARCAKWCFHSMRPSGRTRELR